MGKGIRVRSLKEFGKGAWSLSPESVSILDAVPKALHKQKAYSGSSPHQIIWHHINLKWPGEAELEYKDCVPGRKFRIDIAFPAHMLAIEVDGYAHHALRKEDFARDRVRQNLFVLHGWRVLRFTAGQIHKDPFGCLNTIELALKPSKTEESR